jgi:3-deoxy-manno-octulosonate cytidylyltransferase (CMP-KDO synthetase)
MTSFVAIIPARYSSSRLPGKPLLDIGGKPMVVHVAEKAMASGARAVWIATDHDEIFQTVKRYGFNACLTSDQHPTGTDRIAETVQQLKLSDEEIVVNVQGDEPLIEPKVIKAVAEDLNRHKEAAVATMAHPIRDAAEMFNPNVVKVVIDQRGYGLYFSRAPIPYARDAFAQTKEALPQGLPVYRHLGLYAYRVSFLKQYPKLTAADIEKFEALEQLRVLAHGFKISVALTDAAPQPGVDTEQDLVRVRQLFD